MGNVNSLLDLFNLSEEEINKIIENSKNAKLIYDFLNKSIKYDGIGAEEGVKNEFGFEDLNDFYVEANDEVKNKESKESKGKELLKTKQPRFKKSKSAKK